MVVRFLLLSVALCAVFVPGRGRCAGAEPHSALAAVLARKGGTKIGLAVAEAESGRLLFEYHARRPFQPASVLKVFTSLAAFDLLGPEYQFQTAVLASPAPSGHAAGISIRGSGDPLMTTENLWLLARRIKRSGITAVDTIVLDGTGFVSGIAKRGDRAYEAGAAALALNFNSVAFELCPGAAGRDVRVAIDPWEAGIKTSGRLKSGGQAVLELREQKPLHFRLSGSLPAYGACRLLYRSVGDPQLYFGRVLQQLLADLDVGGAKRLVIGRTPESHEPLFVHLSPSLVQIVAALNHYSTNFIAQQLVYALGCPAGGSCSFNAGLRAVAEFAARLRIAPEECRLEDASGLSAENRVSAKAVITALTWAYNNPRIAPEFLSSLSVPGVSGTLKEQNFQLPGLIIRGKTGTLDQVQALAGYIEGGSRPLVFAILQNGLPAEEGLALQREIVALIGGMAK